MKLTSQNFQNNQQMPVECTCDGKDRSPQLTWSDFSAETKSFALFCNDPDAPGGRWVHWLVVNIPPTVTSFLAGIEMDDHGVEVENSFGQLRYGGPCPPSGEHRYVFTIYALDISSLTNVNRADFEKHIEPHVIDKAQLVGLYSRQI